MRINPQYEAMIKELGARRGAGGGSAQKKDDSIQPRHPGGLLEGGSRELSFEGHPSNYSSAIIIIKHPNLVAEKNRFIMFTDPWTRNLDKAQQDWLLSAPQCLGSQLGTPEGQARLEG